jgi:hypothetical protein
MKTIVIHKEREREKEGERGERKKEREDSIETTFILVYCFLRYR